MDVKVAPAIAALEALIDHLHEQGRPRVWSLVTTVFGDSVLPRGGRIGLAALQEIVGRLRIEPGALRTALSRLASDGTLEREKDGRNAFYSLSDAAMPSFVRASRRIYAAAPPDWDGRWTVAISLSGTMPAERAAALAGAGFAAPNAGTWIRPETARREDADAASFAGLLVLSGKASGLAAPAYVEGLWGLGDLGRSYFGFVENLTPLACALATGPALGPLDALAARTLVNHLWRRIALRDPDLPAALLPADWPGDKARALVKQLYAALDGPAEAWLDEAGLVARDRVARFN